MRMLLMYREAESTISTAQWLAAKVDGFVIDDDSSKEDEPF